MPKTRALEPTPPVAGRVGGGSDARGGIQGAATVLACVWQDPPPDAAATFIASSEFAARVLGKTPLTLQLTLELTPPWRGGLGLGGGHWMAELTTTRRTSSGART